MRRSSAWLRQKAVGTPSLGRHAQIWPQPQARARLCGDADLYIRRPCSRDVDPRTGLRLALTNGGLKALRGAVQMPGAVAPDVHLNARTARRRQHARSRRLHRRGRRVGAAHGLGRGADRCASRRAGEGGAKERPSGPPQAGRGRRRNGSQELARTQDASRRRGCGDATNRLAGTQGLRRSGKEHHRHSRALRTEWPGR